jgi:NAD(P)-dependent dehydrogenase (short-subunit alcohol dehydrogenase family)
VNELAGKTVLVTGATSGLGLEASVKLARMGAETVVVGRDRARLEAAVAGVRARAATQQVSCLLCDFSSQASIRALASEFRSRHARLHVLVNNAGAVSARRRVTVDGLEETFAVNHLGYFLLTNLLLDVIVKSAPARVVNVASVAHRRADIEFDDLQLERGYTVMRAYGRSKLANILFTNELARRLAGSGVTVNSVHPGAVATNIWSRAPWFARPVLVVAKKFMITPERGADAIVHLAASPELEGRTGGYYENGALARPSRLARDEALARRLWDVSARLTTPPVASVTSSELRDHLAVDFSAMNSSSALRSPRRR